MSWLVTKLANILQDNQMDLLGIMFSIRKKTLVSLRNKNHHCLVIPFDGESNNSGDHAF